MDHRPQPDPAALFCLIPLNALAEDIVKDPRNSPRVALNGNVLAFDVGFHVNPKRRHTLLTIGRDQHDDIKVRAKSVSFRHLSFEIDDLATGIVRLWDRSSDKTTHIIDDTQPGSTRSSKVSCMSFRPGFDRRIVVRPNFNQKFEFGNEGRECFVFRLDWIKKSDFAVIHAINNRRANPEDSQSARTAIQDSDDEVDRADCNSRNDSRIATPGRPKLRYIEEKYIGSGGFGQVYKAIDVDGGKLIAIKSIPKPAHGWDSKSWGRVRDEIKCMNRIKNRHIMRLRMSQGFESDDDEIEIIMPLQDGSLDHLIEGSAIDKQEVTTTLLKQMLEALRCLDRNRFVHRDVKPANILYKTLEKANGTRHYHFLLADFGLSKLEPYHNGPGGTHGFYAPEVERGETYTHKADVWSLFATLAFALSSDFRKYLNCRTAVKVAETDQLKHLKAMAKTDPVQRASAKQMLMQEFSQSMLPSPPMEKDHKYLLPNDFTGRTEVDMLKDEAALDIEYPARVKRTAKQESQITASRPATTRTSNDSWNYLPTSNARLAIRAHAISRDDRSVVSDKLSRGEIRAARLLHFESPKAKKTGPQNGIQKISHSSAKERSRQRSSQWSSKRDYNSHKSNKLGSDNNNEKQPGHGYGLRSVADLGEMDIDKSPPL